MRTRPVFVSYRGELPFILRDIITSPDFLLWSANGVGFNNLFLRCVFDLVCAKVEKGDTRKTFIDVSLDGLKCEARGEAFLRTFFADRISANCVLLIDYKNTTYFYDAYLGIKWGRGRVDLHKSPLLADFSRI